MDIVLLPHLPCENNELGICTGLTDQPLSYFGKTLLSSLIPKVKLHSDCEVIFSSTLLRAKESAILYSNEMKVPVIYDDLVIAQDYGEMHNTPMEHIVNIQPKYYYEPFPGGESYMDFLKRYKKFFQKIQKKYKKIALVTHFGTEELLLCLSENKKLEHVLCNCRGSKPTKEDLILRYDQKILPIIKI